MTRSTVARLTPLALAMASMVKGSFILGTSNGSDRVWRAVLERFLCPEAEKATAQPQNPAPLMLGRSLGAWRAK
jgi:hypothetical protein